MVAWKGSLLPFCIPHHIGSLALPWNTSNPANNFEDTVLMHGYKLKAAVCVAAGVLKVFQVKI